MRNPQRIAIIGCSGAGKSTLSGRLAPITDLPLIHLDAEYWNSGWIETPKAPWTAKVRQLIQRERWIIDGNFGSVQEMTIEAADLVVFLDFPRWLCVARVAKRILTTFGKVRPDMAPGYPEQIDCEFFEFVWDFPSVTRPMILERIAKLNAGGKVAVLQSPSAVERFVQEMEQRCRSPKQ